MKHTMKKAFCTMLALSMLICLFAGCGAGEAANNFDGKTIKIGLIGPLTGGAAQYGSAARDGAQLAVDEINRASEENGGIKIEFNAQDDEHDAEKAVNAYNTLKDWGMQVLVGTVTTTPCLAVSQKAFKDRIFTLTPSASSNEVTEGKDNVFQICFNDPNQGKASAQFINEKMSGAKIAIIYDNGDAYSSGIYQTFKDYAKENGMNIVSTGTCTKDTTDFSVQVTDAKNAGADVMFLPIYYTPASLILKQADSIDYAPTFFGVDGMDGILTLKDFDTTLAEGVMLLTPFAADRADEATQTFVSAYQAKYGSIPNQFAADGYDCVYAIYQALTNADLKQGASIKDLCSALTAQFNSMTFSGLTGANMTWENGQVNKAPEAVVIKDQAYVSAG